MYATICVMFKSIMPARDKGFPGGSVVENLPVMQEHRLSPWVWKIPWRRKWQPTPIFLPGKSHGQRSLADYGPWGRKESDMSQELNNNNSERQQHKIPQTIWFHTYEISRKYIYTDTEHMGLEMGASTDCKQALGSSGG